MFHLKNREGNVHKFTKDARKRDELLRQGYVEVPDDGTGNPSPTDEGDDVKGATPYVPKKRSGKKTPSVSAQPSHLPPGGRLEEVSK